MTLSKGGERRGGEVFLRRSKRRRRLPKIRTFKKFGIFFGQTDRQTVVHRKVTLSKNSKNQRDPVSSSETQVQSTDLNIFFTYFFKKLICI